MSWRERLRRDVSWLLALKLGALAVLWVCLFSPSHRCRVDGVATAYRWGLTGSASGQPLPPHAIGGDRCD